MDSENESLPSFHFERTSFFSHSHNSRSGARPKTVDLDTSCIAKIASMDLDVTAYTRRKKEADGSVNRSRSSFLPGPSGSISTLSSLETLPSLDTVSSLETLPSLKTVDSTRDSQFSRKSFSQNPSSDEFRVKKSKSRESSGYSTVMNSSSLNTKAKTLGRKLSSSNLLSSNLSNCSSLSHSFFQPILESTHLDNLNLDLDNLNLDLDNLNLNLDNLSPDLSFKTRDEFLTYSPTVLHLNIPVRSTRRLDRLKIIRSPRETIEVVLKIRAIDSESDLTGDHVLIDLVRDTEIIPANFNGLSNLAIQVAGNSAGSAIIQMVICSKCGKFSFKITIRVQVLDSSS